MSTPLNKATPRARFTGFRDESQRALPIEQEQIAQHCPMFYLQTQRGRLDPQFVSGEEMKRMFGVDSFDETKKWFSHQTMGAVITNGAGNGFFVKRVVDATAKAAGMVICAEVVEAELEPYVRAADGSVTIDGTTGLKQTDPAATKVKGYLIRWVIKPLTDVTNLRGEAIVTPGTLVGKTGAQSSVYPILAMRIGSVGEYGNNIGIRLSAPHAKTAEPGDMFVMEDQRAFLYRLQFVERANPLASAVVQTTMAGERQVDFSFRRGVMNVKTTQTYELSRIIDDYEMQAAGQVPVYGPLDEYYLYSDNLATVVDLLYKAEGKASPTTVPVTSDLLNILTGISYQGLDYYGFRLSADSLAFNSLTTHYFVGGSDGIVSEAKLAELVKTECESNWKNPSYPLVDQARYPISVIYDTGFPLATKTAMFGVVGYRPDISVGSCTQDLSAAENTVSADVSIGTALKAAARLTPESIIHGTEVCRITIYSGMGESVRSIYKRRLPGIMDVIAKRARYMGAGDGRMKSALAYDEAPANHVTELIKLTNTWAPQETRDRLWELGINYMQYADRGSVYWPAFQTVYDDDTSILNSELLMLIMVDVVKQADKVFALLTGDTKLTREQFIEKSDRLITEYVAGRYDNRVTIQPTTYFTGADDARGFSWTTDIAVYGNNMKTVGTYNIIARRSSDLRNAA